MPRAKRHHLPGYVWHITHRCHKREFLLKFTRDRRRWLAWLFEAKKRYGLCILDYTVTGMPGFVTGMALYCGLRTAVEIEGIVVENPDGTVTHGVGWNISF